MEKVFKKFGCLLLVGIMLFVTYLGFRAVSKRAEVVKYGAIIPMEVVEKEIREVAGKSMDKSQRLKLKGDGEVYDIGVEKQVYDKVKKGDTLHTVRDGRNILIKELPARE